MQIKEISEPTLVLLQQCKGTTLFLVWLVVKFMISVLQQWLWFMGCVSQYALRSMTKHSNFAVVDLWIMTWSLMYAFVVLWPCRCESNSLCKVLFPVYNYHVPVTLQSCSTLSSRTWLFSAGSFFVYKW